MKPLALIGMSGSGKSYWGKQLAKEGYTCFCCDELIAAELKPQLTRADGSVMRMGEWMGLPTAPQYLECEKRYLATEETVMRRVLSLVRGVTRAVIDTTGSVIYTSPEILESLKALATIIYIDTPEDVRQQKCREYLAKPLAVLWRGKFSQKEGEPEHEAFSRCYPELIQSRIAAYEALADVRIGYWESRAPDFPVARLVKMATTR